MSPNTEWQKDTKNGEKEFGRPHPDCDINFKDWDSVYKGVSFRKTLDRIKANVKEFFIFNNNQVFYHRFKPSFTDLYGNRHPPSDDEGVSDTLSPGNRKMPDWYYDATPLCVQISFKNEKGENICANIDFQQKNSDFRKQASYFLKVDWDKVEGS